MSYKQRFIIFIVLFAFFGTVGLYWATTQRAKEIEKIEEEVEGVQDFSSAPQITNVAPIEAFIGQEYRYDVAVVDSDTLTGDLLLTIVDGPSWLFKSGLSIYGTPQNIDLGTHNVTFTVTDGSNTITSNFYIVVDTADEASN